MKELPWPLTITGTSPRWLRVVVSCALPQTHHTSFVSISAHKQDAPRDPAAPGEGWGATIDRAILYYTVASFARSPRTELGLLDLFISTTKSISISIYLGSHLTTPNLTSLLLFWRRGLPGHPRVGWVGEWVCIRCFWTNAGARDKKIVYLRDNLTYTHLLTTIVCLLPWGVGQPLAIFLLFLPSQPSPTPFLPPF